MDYSNWNPDIPNDFARRAHIALAQGDKHRKPDMTSWLRRCNGSCRGSARHPAHEVLHLRQGPEGQGRRHVRLRERHRAGCDDPVERHLHHDREPRRSTTSSPTSSPRCSTTRRSSRPTCTTTTARWSSASTPSAVSGTHARPGAERARTTSAARGATRGTGISGHTKIRIAQTATYGAARALAIAHRSRGDEEARAATSAWSTRCSVGRRSRCCARRGPRRGPDDAPGLRRGLQRASTTSTST